MSYCKHCMPKKFLPIIYVEYRIIFSLRSCMGSCMKSEIHGTYLIHDYPRRCVILVFYSKK